MPKTALKVENIFTAYDRADVLENLSLEVEELEQPPLTRELVAARHGMRAFS